MCREVIRKDENVRPRIPNEQFDALTEQVGNKVASAGTVFLMQCHSNEDIRLKHAFVELYRVSGVDLGASVDEEPNCFDLAIVARTVQRRLAILLIHVSTNEEHITKHCSVSRHMAFHVTTLQKPITGILMSSDIDF